VRGSAILLGLLALGASSCREPLLTTSDGNVFLSPRDVDFGAAWVGVEEKSVYVELHNEGRSNRRVEWRLLGEDYLASDLPEVSPAGVLSIEVRFAPQRQGRFLGQLWLSAGEGHETFVMLSGNGYPVPNCASKDPCKTSVFDAATGTCVETVAADGAACETGSACTLAATCQSGRCVGKERSCDDGNACTVDVCNAATGCENLPAPPCPGDGACMVGTCDPAVGCGLKPAADGAACGPVQSCDRAQVCMAGACVERDPPDGYVCAEASPCQGEGRCAGSVCNRPAPTPLEPHWSFDSAATSRPDAGIPAEELHDFVAEPSGAISLSGFFFTAPRLRANTEVSARTDGPVRRCMLWNNRYICADYPAAVNGKVSAIDLATGQTLWTFDLRKERPDFLMETSSIFMARMAVQGSDRLAALFEAYPKGASSGNTNCRKYYLVVLDAQGQLVMAQEVEDPVLDECNHPHPYGFGADSAGNLFVSFSPTIASPAPLKPGSPTLVMTWTRDGIFRWKFVDHSLVGGELAIATGLIYPENSPIAVSTATGNPAFAIDASFGRVVVSKHRAIPAPVKGAAMLDGYEAGTPQKRWTHVLPAPQAFWSDQVRLAQWTTRQGPKTVALTFTEGGVGTARSLLAIDTDNGQTAFSCPLTQSFRTEPQLFEMSDGVLNLMEGSDACGKCDPPYAGSSAAFHTIRTPLLGIAQEPWVGTFGGAGHDHREDVPALPPVLPQQ
jgi:hypothetical protein